MKNKSLFGTLSVAMTPIAVLLAIIAGVIIEYTIEKPASTSMRAYLPEFTRALVLTTLFLIATGVVSGIIALLKNEKPRWFPVLGLLITLSTVIIFHFIAVGPNGD